MLFSEILGQEHIKNHLTKSADFGRIPHAQLFVGPEGSGTLPMAIAYAQYLLCKNTDGENENGIEACNLKFKTLSHPDLHFAFPVATNDKIKSHPVSSNFLEEWLQLIDNQPYGNLFDWYRILGIDNKQGQIGVDEAQDIVKSLSLKAYEGGYKVMIIWMAEKMNMQAANKLLKTIEEPPEKTIIILVTNDSEQIISTILSRTQLVKLGRLQDEEISDALVKNYEMERELADNIAAMTEGDFLQAKQLALHSGEENENFVHFRDWMRLCFKKDIAGVSQWVDKTAKLGRVRQKDYLKYALHMIRQCALFNYGVSDLVKISGDERVFMQKFAPFIDHINLQDYIDLFTDARRHIDRNANAKILFTDLSYQVLVHLKKANDRKAASQA